MDYVIYWVSGGAREREDDFVARCARARVERSGGVGFCSACANYNDADL